MLEGGYQIEELLEADHAGASFTLRVLGDSSAKVYVRVTVAQGEAAEEQLAVWENAKELQHPNLSAPLATGSTEVGGASLIYVVLRRPDERLSDILSARALNRQEAGDVLRSCVRALEHLHSRGLAHGYVSPEQIIAIGESVKLSTECVRRIDSERAVELAMPRYLAPESGEQNVTAAADVWCLGATLFEVLTQKECGTDCREEAARLPAPYGEIAQRCLDPDPETRGKLAEIEAQYQTAAAASLAEKRPEVAVVPEQSSFERRRAVAVPEPSRGRVWVYAAVGLLLLIGVILLTRSKRPTRSGPVAQRSAPAANAAAGGHSVWPTQTLSPEGAISSPPRQPVQQTAKRQVPEAPKRTEAAEKGETPTVNGPVWRVILYTYSRADEAQNKARLLNGKYPGLGVETFTPNGPSGPYLVVAGGQMNREDAMRLKRKVRSMGLPRDSYIQNYKQ